jgi:hypothetical protein
MVFVAVDVGRSAVKVSYTTGDPKRAVYFEVPSLVATSFSGFSRPDSALVNTFSDADVSQIEVKETQGGWCKDFASFFMFGKQAQKQGGSVSAFSEGSQFHKFGVAVTLFVVSKVVDAVKDDKVSLAVNFTYSNNDAVSFYSAVLKGKHKVALGKVKGSQVVGVDTSFTVVDMYCFQQGYASIFNFIGSPQFGVIQSGRGLVVDIGRYTVDFSMVDELTLVNGFSVDFGTSHLIDILLKDPALGGIRLRSQDIEASFINHDASFSTVSGKSVKPWGVLVSGGLLDGYYRELKIALNNFVGEERVDYLILCGGGAYLVKDRFVKDFKVQTMALDYLRANCSGMLKMMTV